MWQEVKTVNKFGNRNLSQYIDGFQCLVFQRKRGWSYTVRYALSEGEWLQWSAGNHQLYEKEIAQQISLEACEKFRLLIANRSMTLTEGLAYTSAR